MAERWSDALLPDGLAGSPAHAVDRLVQLWPSVHSLADALGRQRLIASRGGNLGGGRRCGLEAWVFFAWVAHDSLMELETEHVPAVMKLF